MKAQPANLQLVLQGTGISDCDKTLLYMHWKRYKRQGTSIHPFKEALAAFNPILKATKTTSLCNVESWDTSSLTTMEEIFKIPRGHAWGLDEVRHHLQRVAPAVPVCALAFAL